MRKIYKIYEQAWTTLENNVVSHDYGDKTTYMSFLLRGIFADGYDKRDDLINGFNTLEEAEKFIEDNIGGYDNWIILTKYKK